MLIEGKLMRNNRKEKEKAWIGCWLRVEGCWIFNPLNGTPAGLDSDEPKAKLH
jgi:hypothetical protein